MDTDWDTNPHYRGKRHGKHWRLPALLAAGAIAGGMAILMFATDRGQPAPIIRDQPDSAGPSRRETAKAPLSEQPTHRHNEQVLPSATPPAPPPAQARQTVFNAQNYRPRTDINILPSIRSGMAGNRERPQQRQPMRRRMSAGWNWTTEHGREGGQFVWDDADGRIEWGSVCSNERRGSFRYRDCRKGAKETFARLCAHYPPACMAENHYNPL